MGDTLNHHDLRLRLDSPQKTLELGQAVAKSLKCGLVIALTGELGAGKTVFTRGVGIGLGIPQEHITSPTFTLIQEYPAPIPLIHVDLYRLESPAELLSLGLSEYFDSNYFVVIEWADRLGQTLPPDRIEVRLEHGEDSDVRWITISGTGPESRQAIARLQASLSNSYGHPFDHPSST